LKHVSELYSQIDLLREERIGIPEAIYGKSKSIPELLDIASKFISAKKNFIATKLDTEKIKALQKKFPQLHAHERAGLVWKRFSVPPLSVKPIGLLSAGTSDRPIYLEAAITLSFLGNRVVRFHDVGVAGIHRLIEKLPKLQDASLLIVVAGMEGALPTVVSGLSGKPIIAVPTSVGYGTAFDGMTALHAMLSSCSPTVTVVNIDNGFGAAVAATVINRQIN
jgi:hypothetical protein